MTVLGQRYVKTALLKSALGIETLLGRDLHTGKQVVVKQTAAARIPPNARLRLEHEAQVLRELASPWVAPLLDVGRDGDVVYLVMPFVPGITVADRIARDGPLPVADALAIARGVMRALQAVHERGVLHRDVKPANVIVGAASPPERVVLVDFGLARSGYLETPLRDVPVGSAAYVSPEQAGLIHSEVAERSDLYSAGIVVFECLAGRRPFEGATAADVLRQHLGAAPPVLGRLGLPVPRALDAVVQRLLAKDPRDRYQSAAAVLADLDELAAAIERGDRDPPIAVGARDTRRGLAEPAFVGRDDERRLFAEEVSRLADGRPRLTLLEGDSGGGKTRLLDEFAVTASQHGAWVLRGQSSDRIAGRPLQVLDRVVEEIAAAARADPQLGEALRARLGEHLAEVCAALPPLGPVLEPDGPTPAGPEAFGEVRTVAALVALVDALGIPERPAVILLDDCQWLDELSLKLLVRWHREHEAEVRPASVLLVAAFRGDEIAHSSPLRRLAPATRIALRPLTPPEVRRMAESIAGTLPAEAIELVRRLSEGNPFLVGAVVEGLVEGGALVAAAHGWELQPHAMAEAQSSLRAAAFLARRLEKLPPQVLHLLSVGAVLGKAFEVRLAADLAGCSWTEAMAAVAEARRRHLVWIDRGGIRCSFVHDRLRDSVLERLAPHERVRVHRFAAAALERTPPGPDREFDLAYHFDAAGDPANALPHALAAASQARARCSLEIAERCYRIAERGAALDAAGSRIRRRVAGGLGDVLLMRGRYEEAGTWFAEALALSESALERAEIEGKLGELAFKRGDVPAASHALERALALVGRSVPRTPARMALAALWQALVQVAHTLWPGLTVGRRRLEDGEADLLAARIFSRLAYANWFRRGQVATFWAHLSGMNLAERYPPTRERAQAYSEHSISVTGLPRVFFARGARYAERGLAIRRDLGDVWGQGQSLNFHGMLLYAFGRYEEALSRFSEAVRVLRRTGDRWEANVAAAHVAFCHFRLGSLRDAVAECRGVHRDGQEIDDLHAMAFILEIWAKASGGLVPPELVEAALRRTDGDPQRREMVLQAEGVRRIGAGRPREAAAAFAAAEEVSRSVNLRSEYVSYIAIWEAQARRLAALQAMGDAGALLPAELREAERTLRRGLRSARRYRGNLPMALRERALLDAMRGRLRRARRALDESLAESERLGSRFEALQTRLARGEIGRCVGWPGAEAETARARVALHEMGAAFACHPLRVWSPELASKRVTLSLADRFTSIVDEGRRIASAVTPEDVHASLCVAASVLLRGETSLVVEVGGDEPRVCAQVGAPVEVSRSAVERAVRQGRPIVVTDPLEGPPSESLVLANLRSVLCAPVAVDGRPVACLYVAHALVDDLFDGDELRIAGYLATLAGASLGRAAAFRDLETLSHTLEQRVEERTSALRAANVDLDAHLRRLRETQDQLVQAAKMAAVGTLMAGLSHELNNPLGVILGYAQAHLRKMAPDDPVRPAMAAIERQARRCADLVSMLLDFSRKRDMEREEIPLETLVRRVVALAALKAGRQDVRLELGTPFPDRFRVRVAPTQIESALLNVVDNAADASPAGATIEIEAVASPRAFASGVEVRIRDHGPGIARDVLPRIFDPFFTTKPPGQGTGLGLPLARQFIEGHGGEVSVESRPGEGTTVKLWLPTCERSGESLRGTRETPRGS